MPRCLLAALLTAAVAGCAGKRNTFKANIAPTTPPGWRPATVGPASSDAAVAASPQGPAEPNLPWNSFGVQNRPKKDPKDRDQRRRSKDEQEDEQKSRDYPSLEQMWDWGYGFGNPNNKRIKEDLPPEPFEEEDEENFDKED